MTRYRNAMDVLSRLDCLQLLGEAEFGRIAVTIGALPVVLPVSFALFDGDILIRAAHGTKLVAAATDAVVAFEVDSVDPIHRTGWSVLVQGIARGISNEDELRRARTVPLSPWTGPDDHYLRL